MPHFYLIPTFKTNLKISDSVYPSKVYKQTAATCVQISFKYPLAFFAFHAQDKLSIDTANFHPPPLGNYVTNVHNVYLMNHPTCLNKNVGFLSHSKILLFSKNDRSEIIGSLK